MSEEERKNQNEARRNKRMARSMEKREAHRRETRANMTTEERNAKNAARREDRAVEVAMKQVDFSLKISDPIPEGAFHDFEQNPERSALLYHLNSGHGKFRSIDALLNSALDNDEKVKHAKQLKEEIKDEMLSVEEHEALLANFLVSQGRAVPPDLSGKDSRQHPIASSLPPSVDAHLLVCGVCGMKSMEGRNDQHYSLVALEDLPSVLQLNQDEINQHEKLEKQGPLELPIDNNGNTRLFYPHKVRSIYHSKKMGMKFHLHPEFVHIDSEKEVTVLCPRCSLWYEQGQQTSVEKNHAPPPNSIAAGIDFGDASRVGLESPTVAEMVVIARVRHFHNVVKIQNNHLVGGRSDFTKSVLRAHSVLFRHDAPLVLSLSLLMKQAKLEDSRSLKDDLKELFCNMLTIELLGPNYAREKLAYKAKMQTLVQVRPHIVYQWLAVLGVCHRLYRDDPQLSELTNFASFKHVMDEANKEVFQKSIHINEDRALLLEKYLGDDVSQVRSGILHSSDLPSIQNSESAINSTGSTSMNVSYSYVKSASNIEKEIAGKDPNRSKKMATYIADVAEAFNVDLLDASDQANNEEILKSVREEDPMDEFSDMQELLVGAFPQVFMLGQTYKRKSLLNHSQLEHLLMQYTNAAATNRELLFYLFDCQSRHRVIRNLAAKVRKDPSAFESYAKLVRDQNFQTLIREAKKNPTSDAASEVMRRVLPVLAFGSRENTMSNLVGNPTSISRGLAMGKRYGGATTLLTVTPDDINNPTGLRLASKSLNNMSFPAVIDEEFFQQLEKGGEIPVEGFVKMPLNYTQRFKVSSQNPVAVAYEFRSMMENIIEILIGCPLDFRPGTNSGQKRTWYFKSKAHNSPHHKGIFGYVVAHFGCIETQARGALHFHIILWGGISPNLLEKAASMPEVCTWIEEALDTMYTAEIPRSIHVRDMITQKMKESLEGRKLLPTVAKMYPSLKHVPSPRLVNKWKDHFSNSVVRNGIHKHSFTCKKPPAGRHRCRGARPSGDSSATLPVLLEVPSEADEAGDGHGKHNKKTLSNITPIKSDQPIQQLADPKQRNYFESPLPPLDHQLVVWELKRPLLEVLPNLLDRYTKAYELVRSNKNVEATQEMEEEAKVDTALVLEEAKQFCIANIVSCLQENGAGDTYDSAPCLQKWLEGLEPATVVYLYIDLNSQITDRNGLVTETNPTLSNATGASTNAVLIGNTQQATAALFYVIPYVCKKKVALEACLTALEAAQMHVEKYPSIAEDSGTNKRYVQHMFTRVLNDLARSVELSDTQVALSLLNTGSEITSDTYRYFGANYSVNYFLHRQQELATDHKLKESREENNKEKEEEEEEEEEWSDDESCCNSSCCCDDTCPFMEIGNIDPAHAMYIGASEGNQQDDNPPRFTRSSKNFGPAPFYKVKLGTDEAYTQQTGVISVPVQYPVHWQFRGKELKSLTQVEYYALIDIKLIDSKEGKTIEDLNSDNYGKRGRRLRKRFRFHPGHPLYHSHCQVLRAKQPTLIFNAYPPKFPGKPPEKLQANATAYEIETYQEDYKKWFTAATKFAIFYETCFLPHTTIYGDAQQYEVPSWNSFCSRIQEMEQSNLQIDRLRLDAMFTFIYAMQSNYKRKILLSNFRHRHTTRWTKGEQEQASTLFRRMGVKNRFFQTSDAEDLLNGKLSMEVFTTSKVKQYGEDLKFSRAQSRTMKMLFQDKKEACLPSMNVDSPLVQETSVQGEKYSIGDASIGKILRFDSDSGSAANEVAKTLASTSFTRFTHKYLSASGDKPSRKRYRDGTFLDLRQQVNSYLQLRDLSASQAKVIQQAVEYFFALKQHKDSQSGIPGNPIRTMYACTKIAAPLFLLTGEPGSGKSYVIETIQELVAIMGLGNIAASSYNGIAAVNIDGSTICSLFLINDRSSSGTQAQLQEDTLLQLRERLMADILCGLIVDEVSTIDTRIIALLNYRLQQVTGNFDAPFGGLPIFFVGDFNQLGPVQKTFIPKDMMAWALRKHRKNPGPSKELPKNKNKVKSIASGATAAADTKQVAQPRRAGLTDLRKSFSKMTSKKTNPKEREKEEEDAMANRLNPGSLPYEGCMLFSKFRRFHLYEQQRASDDKEHMALVKKLSSGMPIEIEDILKYDHLSKEDIEEHPDEWKYAPVLVSTNLERLNITRQKAQMWAKDHQTYVFKWRNITRHEVNRPDLHTMEKIREGNSFFWQFFVSGAPCNLSQGINGDLALVNGAPITAHSLTFSNANEFRRITELLKGPDAPPFGSEIEIELPSSVNVIVQPSLDSKPLSSTRKAQLAVLKKFSIIPGDDIVIPIAPTSPSSSKSDYNKFAYSTGNLLTPFGTAEILENFPFDLAFSMTIHKAQGRTIERVVLDLTYHSNHYTRMKYAAVFVALSRVKCRKHLRLLRHKPSGLSFDPLRAYGYLPQLRPSREICAFYHGFSQSPGANTSSLECDLWNPSRALSYSQSMSP